MRVSERERERGRKRHTEIIKNEKEREIWKEGERKET
jgi:hypothetical protein